MNPATLHKLVVRVFDPNKDRFIPKFDHTIACGRADELEPIKLLIQNCDRREGWAARVDYRRAVHIKEYFIMPWQVELPEGREP